MSKKIDTKDLDEQFEKLVSEDKLDIDSIEKIMLTDIEEYKKELKLHIEELLSTKINEKELISKKSICQGYDRNSFLGTKPTII